MQDNTKRGERVLFWMKVIIVLFFVLRFLPVLLFGLLTLAEGNFVQSIMKSTAGFWYLFGICIVISMVFSGFVLLGAFFAFCVRYLSWLYRAISNLRLLTTTSFSPMGAVLLTCIPYFGYFLNYFIFRDMVKSQEKYMEQHGILKKRFPKKILNAWFIASLVLLILVFEEPNPHGFMTIFYMTLGFDGNNAITFLEKTLIVIISILYIMSFSAYVKQEREIYRIHTEELFNKHVDEVIREREIERVAKMIRESQGLEPTQTNQEK